MGGGGEGPQLIVASHWRPGKNGSCFGAITTPHAAATYHSSIRGWEGVRTPLHIPTRVHSNCSPTDPHGQAFPIALPLPLTPTSISAFRPSMPSLIFFARRCSDALCLERTSSLRGWG